MDGMGTLYGTLCGNTRDVLQKISVDLPKKHGRGGQSSVRFARLRVEKRHNYMRKVGELAVGHYIPDGEKPNIKGLVLAGAAELKNELVTNGLLVREGGREGGRGGHNLFWCYFAVDTLRSPQHD